MYKHTLTVFREDLDAGAVLTGGTQGAIELLVIADASSVVIAAETGAVTVTHCDTETGTYETVVTQALTAGTYAKGAIIARVALPVDIKAWAKATVAGNTGDVVVKQAYIAR